MSAGQVIQFPFVAGIDEGTDSKGLPPGTLLSLVNAAWTKDKRIDKRFGTAAVPMTLAAGGSISSGARLMPRDVLGLADNNNLNAYAPGIGWRSVAQLAQYTSTWSTAVDTVSGVCSWDVCLIGVYEVLVWTAGDPLSTTSGATFLSVRDTSSGAVILPPTAMGFSAEAVRLVAGPGVAYLVTTASPNIVVCTITAATGAFTGNTTLRTDGGSNIPFDAMLVSGTTLVIAFVSTGANPKLKFASFLVSGPWSAVNTGSLTGEVSTFFGGVSIDGDASDAIYVVYSPTTTPNVKVATLDPVTLAVVNAPVTLDAGQSAKWSGVVWQSSGRALITWAATGTPNRASSAVYLSAAGGSIDTTTKRGTYGLVWCSRPWTLDGRTFALASTFLISSANLLDPASTVVVEIETSAKAAGDWQPHRHVATIDTLIGGFPVTRILPRGYALSGSISVVLSPYQSTPTPNQKNSRQGLRRVTLVPRGGDYARPVSYGTATYFPAGVVAEWDGTKEVTLGFAHAPVITAASDIGGGSMAAGTYLYSVVAEYRDASGTLQRSPPSVPIAVTVAATGRVSMSISAMSLDHHEADIAAAATSTQRSVTLAVYRTTVGQTNLYRLTMDPTSNVVVNDPFNGTVTFVDSVIDTNIDGSNTRLDSRPLLYTTGGYLEDRQAVAMTTLLSHRGRLWGIDGGKRTLCYTKSFVDDPTVAAAWPDPFKFVFDEDLVGLASMDDKLIVFSATSIWLIFGDGPAANGQNSNFDGPTRVQTDVGCTNARSIVATPNGIMFLSARGLYQLSRTLELGWVGKQVQDSLAAFPTITSACLVASRNQVRFTCNAANGASGRVLVFDYLRGQWSEFSYTDTAGGVASTPIADACVWSGVWTFVTAGGQVYTENGATYLDGGSAWVSQSWELADISADGPLGYQRVRKAFVLGDRFTDCDLTLSFDVDGKGTYPQSFTWTSDKLAQFNDGANVGMRVGSQSGMSPRSRAFRARLSDAAPTGAGAVVGTGRGCNFSGVGLEIVPKPGLVRRSARARA